jgi:hypothetical protein
MVLGVPQNRAENCGKSPTYQRRQPDSSSLYDQLLEQALRMVKKSRADNADYACQAMSRYCT